MTVTIIGLGLIGGSMAISIKEKGIAGTIIGVDKNESNAKDALNIGLVDEIADLDEAVYRADFVIIAVPVDQTKLLLPEILDRINSTTTVIDVGSTKEGICRVADQHKNRGNFVATHPIAGTENFGPLSAFHGLFDGKLLIICDSENSFDFAVKKTKEFYNVIGMKIINMQAKEHDLHAAYVSHLSHISAFTLGLTVLEIEKEEEKIFELESILSRLNLQKKEFDEEKIRQRAWPKTNRGKFGVLPRRLIVFPRIVRNIVSGLVVAVIVIYLGSQVWNLLSPPKLEVLYPAENFVSAGRELKILGRVEGGSELSLNNKGIAADSQGWFQVDIDLNKGLNIIKLEAKKSYGRTSVGYRMIIVE